MRQVVTLFLVATLLAMLTACTGKAATPTATIPTVQSARSSTAAASTAVSTRQASATPMPTSPIVVEYDKDDLAASASQADVANVKLTGDGITFVGKGATVKGKVLTITSAGTYSISGKLNDGQIVVDTKDAEKVVLVLNAADITNATGPAIYVANAEKTIITLADGTENHVADGASYVLKDATDEPNAAIFSHDDLTINGSGALTVKANYNNGIASKDDLKITGGNITVQAVNDGIKGRDALIIKDGKITINAGGDGLQANNDEDTAKGYVAIEGGTLNITAGLDGIQAETQLLVSGGNITLLTGGGSARKAADSAKGLKAGVALTVTAGVVSVNAADDALHANSSITISGGEFLLASADDGIHADATVVISGGDVRITKSYEGIESNQITLNAGTIHLIASDDGINGASSGGGAMQGRPGGVESGNSHLYINGGYIVVDALGDGIDINGAVDMTGGTVLVNGPTANNNGALDHSGFKITGGFLVAAGSAGMAQVPDTTSTQYSLMHNYATPQAAGTLVYIATKDGKALLAFAPTKTYQSIVVSSPEIKNGSTYVVYSGGRSTGTVTDGLYSGGTYTAGAQAASYTISGIVTGAGAGMGGMPGGRGGARPARP